MHQVVCKRANMSLSVSLLSVSGQWVRRELAVHGSLMVSTGVLGSMS